MDGKAPRSSRITFIILRFMRRPLLVLVCVYAVSMVGWILIPGRDVHGNPENLSFFHAFYFLTYTVTTTGFGELPSTFTEAQRMWGILSLYVGVIAWFYALGSIVGLVQNADFQQSVMERRFAKLVNRITEPFYIVCGFGNTGALVTRGLSEVGNTVVVIDKNIERTKTISLRDYGTLVAGLWADARVPEHLIEAGILKANCKAVIALTQDEDVNLKISVTARLLNPAVWVVTQSTSQTHEDTLATLGENVHIIDPFQTYAKYLGATVKNPGIHTLNQWLAGTPGATLEVDRRPPTGHWILCGFGRMGRWIYEALRTEGIDLAVIEPGQQADPGDIEQFIVGRASQENLRQAEISEAVGIVAGTDSDSDNLSILLNARALNPNLFTVVRQNKYRNQVVFRAADADFIMMPSLVSARRIFFLLVAPMLKTFFEALLKQDAKNDGRYLDDVIEQLQSRVGGSQPRLWTISTGALPSQALQRTIAAHRRVTLRNLLSDPVERNRSLDCLPLVLRSGTETHILPDLDTAVTLDDEILFCGSRRAFWLLDATFNNEYTLAYLVTGKDPIRSWALKWLFERFGQSGQSRQTAS